jgi:hypothetical protein
MSLTLIIFINGKTKECLEGVINGSAGLFIVVTNGNINVRVGVSTI